MPPLSSEDVQSRLAQLPGWAADGDSIAKEFRFPGFRDAIAFVVRLALAAEVADHHPDVDIRYDRVRVVLSTHSEGGVTEKDLALAAEADAGQQH
jgi:4a-hydroxytetrahydrobiopterin dehydratase